MFNGLSDDVINMIKLSRLLVCLDTEYLYISNIKDKYNYNKGKKAELVRAKLHETIIELDNLRVWSMKVGNCD
jgi:hypothetical protein